MFDEEKVKQGVRLILEGIGEDVDREGLKETPDRIARMYRKIFSSVGCPNEDLSAKVFEIENNHMVIERNITYYSMCEHHLLPFFGRAAIAYVPDGEVIGLSKLARIVDFCSYKPQLQERLTDDIAHTVSRKVKNKGVFVLLEAEHLCVSMRGVKKPGSSTVTMASTGCFLEDKDKRDEVLSLIRQAAY